MSAAEKDPPSADLHGRAIMPIVESLPPSFRRATDEAATLACGVAVLVVELCDRWLELRDELETTIGCGNYQNGGDLFWQVVEYEGAMQTVYKVISGAGTLVGDTTQGMPNEEDDLRAYASLYRGFYSEASNGGMKILDRTKAAMLNALAAHRMTTTDY